MFSFILVGCNDGSYQDVAPDPADEIPPGAEAEADAGAMPDPGAETEDNSTDGES
ncbi:MAG: hypothetical protein HN617_05985 [Planctomycetaceae bacterium]|jgi:hypothetical protein|nr:hypothetical protein [Planctomycetaceae bacterium]MBT4012100.1 hypothetical protein [Planctomycetaceae bacterium]MBT4726369.1 hypothetical protein [Planctomycetaceae bacterium]MBT4845399.1 hypothetical protein [Planctomycetaceae bacterium]MBT5126024.1 hypothetical protein [Planctomycetaceae bacterium]